MKRKKETRKGKREREIFKLLTALLSGEEKERKREDQHEMKGETEKKKKWTTTAFLQFTQEGRKRATNILNQFAVGFNQIKTKF